MNPHAIGAGALPAPGSPEWKAIQQNRMNLLAAVAEDARRRAQEAPSSDWSHSVREWVDYSADLAWRAANAPANFARHQFDEMRQQAEETARTLGRLALDAQKAGLDRLSESLTQLAATMREMFKAYLGIPPEVAFLIGIGLLFGGGWLLLGTTGGQALVGSITGAVGSGARLAARGASAYATGGATEIARAAI